MSPKVTIIVPAYQVEEYIGKCLNSLAMQTFTNYEVIIIDDGSTDRTLMIARSYARTDCRFKIISQGNRGLSAARNIGLVNAKGKYIAFIDADDYIDRNMLQDIVKQIEFKDSDIVIPIMNVFVDEKTFSEKTTQLFLANKIAEDKPLDYVVEVLLSQGRNWSVARGALYKKNIIEANEIRFPEGYIAEDIIFNLEYFKHVGLMSFTNKPYYYYLVRQKSITHSINNMLLASIFLVDKKAGEFLDSISKDDIKLQQIRNSLFSRNIIIYVNKNIINDNNKTIKAQIADIKKLFKISRVDKAFAESKFIVPYWPEKKNIIFILAMRYLLKKKLLFIAVWTAKIANLIDYKLIRRR